MYLFRNRYIKTHQVIDDLSASSELLYFLVVVIQGHGVYGPIARVVSVVRGRPLVSLHIHKSVGRPFRDLMRKRVVNEVRYETTRPGPNLCLGPSCSHCPYLTTSVLAAGRKPGLVSEVKQLKG